MGVKPSPEFNPRMWQHGLRLHNGYQILKISRLRPSRRIHNTCICICICCSLCGRFHGTSCGSRASTGPPSLSPSIVSGLSSSSKAAAFEKIRGAGNSTVRALPARAMTRRSDPPMRLRSSGNEDDPSRWRDGSCFSEDDADDSGGSGGDTRESRGMVGAEESSDGDGC